MINIDDRDYDFGTLSDTAKELQSPQFGDSERRRFDQAGRVFQQLPAASPGSVRPWLMPLLVSPLTSRLCAPATGHTRPAARSTD
ncbi:MAG: hypothetical protein Q7J42_01845 [Sulfuritalea sp.]|nr:hypothetical protein [Sulfuritalea sp.]